MIQRWDLGTIANTGQKTMYKEDHGRFVKLEDNERTMKEKDEEIAALKVDRDLWKDRAVVVASHLDYDTLCGDIQKWIISERATRQEEIATLKADAARWQAVNPNACDLKYILSLEADNSQQADQISSLQRNITVLQTLVNGNAAVELPDGTYYVPPPVAEYVGRLQRILRNVEIIEEAQSI